MKTTITKKDVAKRTAKICGEKIYLTEKVVDGVFTALREFMEEANPEIRIEIRDFGVFEVKTTKPKPKARNPKTGEIIYVPARRKTHFKAGKLLKEVLKQPLSELAERDADKPARDWQSWQEGQNEDQQPVSTDETSEAETNAE